MALNGEPRPDVERQDRQRPTRNDQARQAWFGSARQRSDRRGMARQAALGGPREHWQGTAGVDWIGSAGSAVRLCLARQG